MNEARLYIVSTGPGTIDLIPQAAREAIKKSECIIGYKTYIDMITPLIGGKDVFGNGMRQEIDRCTLAVNTLRDGRDVAMICGGDAGVFSLAGLIFELAEEAEYDQITVIPGITAATAAAALLGAPLIHDFVVLSLSDLLTEADLIKRRVKMAIEGDYVLVLYNPKSIKRLELYNWVLEEYRANCSSETPVGIVRNGYRKDQSVVCLTLEEAFTRQDLVDMRTVVVIGNSSTKRVGDRMITPRGYNV